MTKKVLVTGAGGFIGHHLVNELKKEGYWVRGVDWKEPEFPCNADEFLKLDLRDPKNCETATEGIEDVYALAADMGGMGFIQDKANQILILHNNTMINFHTLAAALKNGAKRYLYTSSACIYPEHIQTDTNSKPLAESDAYPAQPQDSYGWEKLQAEHMCKYYCEAGLQTRVVRFHNIYGPEGTWYGGRDKAPAALTRKVIQAIDNGDDFIEIWGDGEQTRSFCHITDCIKGIRLIMEGESSEPVNLGRDELVSINELARAVLKIAGGDLTLKHIDGPEGVRGRNSDNTFFEKTYNWKPEINIEDGMADLYKWVKAEFDTLKAAGKLNEIQ